MRELRNLYRFIPFGIFSLSGRGRPPFNQVFVGRQKERADFIELLTHQERFGAYLISGQRGAGKTSFVDYCLDKYERIVNGGVKTCHCGGAKVGHLVVRLGA